MTDHGIDYGLGMANRDPHTGIRFGVIPMNRLHEWAYEDFDADYGPPTCPRCGHDAADYDDDKHGGYEGEGCADYACESCELIIDSSEAFADEAIGYTLDDGEYKAEAHADGDCFVIRSPYYTHARYCSPCAPGACYLLNPTDDSGPRAYCFGHDWFEGGKAPYPVYRVDTGELVEPV